MRSAKEHKWSRSDDLVAFYVSRHGPQRLGMLLSEIADRLGIPLGSMKMRISNAKAEDGRPGLSNAAKQTCSVVELHRRDGEPELRRIVIQRLAAVGP